MTKLPNLLSLLVNYRHVLLIEIATRKGKEIRIGL